MLGLLLFSFPPASLIPVLSPSLSFLEMYWLFVCSWVSTLSSSGGFVVCFNMWQASYSHYCSYSLSFKFSVLTYELKIHLFYFQKIRLKLYFIFLRFYLSSREGGRKRGREISMSERNIGCFSHVPNCGHDPQPRQVPCLGIEPEIFWFAGKCPIHWATQFRAQGKIVN